MKTISLNSDNILNLEYTKGTDFGPILLRLSEPNSNPKVYYDMTGHVMTMKMKISEFDEEPVVEFSQANNEIVPSGDGQVVLFKESTGFSNVHPMSYIYELFTTTADGLGPYSVLKGTITVLGSVNS